MQVPGYSRFQPRHKQGGSKAGGHEIKEAQVAFKYCIYNCNLECYNPEKQALNPSTWQESLSNGLILSKPFMVRTRSTPQMIVKAAYDGSFHIYNTYQIFKPKWSLVYLCVDCCLQIRIKIAQHLLSYMKKETIRSMPQERNRFMAWGRFDFAA
jgi:hypothetical protein